MNSLDIGIDLILSVVLIVGAYQFYFFTQRQLLRTPRHFQFALDERIPFQPGWSWVYSFLYYPAILYLNLVASSPGHFTRMAFSFILLLAMPVLCFAIYPVATPTALHTQSTLGPWAFLFPLLIAIYLVL